jgi:hypothetical protein
VLSPVARPDRSRRRASWCSFVIDVLLRNPSDQLIDLLGRETTRRTSLEPTPEDAKDFLSFLKSLTPRHISDDSVQVVTDDEGPHTFQKVEWVEIDGDCLRVASSDWADTVVLVCDKISRENRENFDAWVQSNVWSDGGRPWFSRDRVKLQAGRPIEGTDRLWRQSSRRTTPNSFVTGCHGGSAMDQRLGPRFKGKAQPSAERTSRLRLTVREIAS